MKTSEIRSVLEALSEAIQNLSESSHKLILNQLLNLVESTTTEMERLRKENQELRDENNRLKGEQGKPNIRPQAPKSGDISSEKERKISGKKKKKRRSRNSKLKITRTEKCKLDRSNLPEDVVFKGYETVIVQDMKVVVETIRFKEEIYYSPKLNKSFMASLPTGYKGEFGPHLKSLVLGLKHICLMSEPKILEFIEDHGIQTSVGTISRILLNQDWAHEERKAIFQAGLSSSIHQHIDDTKARVNGQNYHTHILCNEFYTAYFTTEHKDRLTVLDILRGFKPRAFLLNEEFVELLEILGLAEKWIALMRLHLNAMTMDELQMKTLLDSLSGPYKMGEKIQKRILEAAAIAAYHLEDDCIDLLVCDDAPQFKLLALDLALCWIHEGRHYKKLSPVVPHHQELLKSILEDFWSDYHQLREFQNGPNEVLAQALQECFDELFSLQTGYHELDQRMTKTRSRVEALLQVLKHPQIPLHNNSAELGARSAVRRRDVSLHTINLKGTQANDDFMTLAETARKQGVSRFSYLFDRVSGSCQMTPLAQLITEKTLITSELDKTKNERFSQGEDAAPPTKINSFHERQTTASFFLGVKKIPLYLLKSIRQGVRISGYNELRGGGFLY
jgi:cell division protein FtsB